MPIIPINDLAEVGIITDKLPMQLESNAWSSGKNVRFTDNKVEKTTGWEVYRDTGLNWDGGSGEQVYWAIPYNYLTTPLWVYAGLKDVRVYDGTTDKEITRASGYYSASAQTNWTGGILSNILIMNNGVDLPQTWDGDFSVPSKLVDLANFSSQAERCGAMRVYKNYLIALDVTKSNIRYKSLVKWSDSAALGELPASWDATDATTDAGETDLSEKTKDVSIGALIDCLPLRNTNIVYSDSQVWAMDFIGGQFVFNFRQIFKNNGILSARCVQEFEGKHFVVGNGDVYVHDGNTLKSVIDAKRRRFLFSDMDSSLYRTTYVFANYPEKEMWVCYAEEGSPSGLPNKALIWNWRNGTWGQKDLPEGSSSVPYGTPHTSSGIVDTSVGKVAADNPIEICLDFATDNGVSELFDPLGTPTVGFPATGTYDGSDGNPAGSMTFYTESDGGDTYYYRKTLAEWGVPSDASVTNISLLTVDAKGETVGTAFNYLPQVTLRLENLDYVSFKEPAGGNWNGSNDWEALTAEFGDTITYPIASDVELTLSVKAFGGGGTTDSHQMWYDNICFSITHTGGFIESSDKWSSATDSWLTVDRVWDSGGFRPQSQSPLMCADKLYKGDASNTHAGTSMVSFVERTDIPMGEDDLTVRIKAIYPKMSGNAAVNVYVGSHKAPGDSPSYSAPVFFTPGSSKKVDARRTGTHMAIKVESTGDQEWCLYGYDVEIEPTGRR